MEEVFFIKDFFQFWLEYWEGDVGNRCDEIYCVYLFGMVDDELVEEVVNGVYEEYEGKGQYKEYVENNQWMVMFEFVEKVGSFDVGGLFGGCDNVFFGVFVVDKQGYCVDDYIDGVYVESGVVC